MKLFFVILLAFPRLCFSQDWEEFQPDSVYLSILRKGLKVGDTMPDIELGTIVNIGEKKMKLSDFKAKLIILDYWNTSCGSCIAGFPKMEELQEKFKDKIQILLVNLTETKDFIDERFEMLNKKTNNKAVKKFRLPNLPTIVADSLGYLGKNQQLSNLFPLRFIPHHVWIDSNRVIRLRGYKTGTYEQKIEDYLSGRDFIHLNDNNTTIMYDDANWPYWKLLGHLSSPTIKNSSIISSFNNEYSALTSGYSLNIVDSQQSTIRSTFINMELLRILFLGPYADFFSKNDKNILLFPRNLYSYKSFELNVSDTLLYSSSFVKANGIESVTDLDDVKSRVCYEIIRPIKSNIYSRNLLMIEDINRYLKENNNSSIYKIVKKVPCYVLVRTKGVDKISSKSKVSRQDYFFYKGEKYCRFLNMPLQNVFQRINEFKYISNQLSNNRRKGMPSILINESGIGSEAGIDLIIPDEEVVTDIQTLRLSLKKYNLDIITEFREIEVVRISDSFYNARMLCDLIGKASFWGLPESRVNWAKLINWSRVI